MSDKKVVDFKVKLNSESVSCESFNTCPLGIINTLFWLALLGSVRVAGRDGDGTGRRRKGIREREAIMLCKENAKEVDEGER